MLSFFPRDVLDVSWDLIESVSGGFLPSFVLPVSAVLQTGAYSDYVTNVYAADTDSDARKVIIMSNSW